VPDNENSDVNLNVEDVTPFKEAYERHLPEFQALSVDELVIVNVDISLVVTTVLGSLPEILALAPEIAEQLPKFDLARIKNLESYAMALSHANTLYLLANQPPDALQALIDEGTKLRETLLADANALARRGSINGNRLQDLKGAVGHRNVAVDLQLLTTLFRESFAQIEGKTGTTVVELNRGEFLAAGILRAVGLKEQGTALIAATSDVRVRALTQLLRVYDSARRAIGYLRWNENDADTIAPSLYAGRNTGRKKAGSDVAQTPKATPPKPTTPAEQASTGSPAGGTPAPLPQPAASGPAVGRTNPFLG